MYSNIQIFILKASSKGKAGVGGKNGVR